MAAALVQDVIKGKEALEADLERFLAGRSLMDLGWAQPSALALHIPLFATTAAGGADFYLLQLLFDHYPRHPPGARFINPLTGRYDVARDACWVPHCEGASDIHFHPRYSDSNDQLICSSMTLEFYQVNHGVQPEHRWVEGQHRFPATLAAIRRGMATAFYRGRWA